MGLKVISSKYGSTLHSWMRKFSTNPDHLAVARDIIVKDAIGTRTVYDLRPAHDELTRVRSSPNRQVPAGHDIARPKAGRRTAKPRVSSSGVQDYREENRGAVIS
jgi:hypothetical protein